MESQAAKKRLSIQTGITMLYPKFGSGIDEVLFIFHDIKRFIFLFSIVLFGVSIASIGQNSLAAPDTLRISIQQAEKIFLDSNLQLLAQHYNIQSSKALVEQARKWDNPVLNTDQNIYANNRFFQHGTDASGNPQGEVFAQVQQLIKTAGKRGHQIDLAKTNVNQAEWQFKSVMRNLRATLLQDYYTLAQLEGNAALYQDNLQRLTKLQSAMQSQLSAGNIARKEFLRVQALLISLKQDIAENDNSITDAENELKTVLQITGNTFILPVTGEQETAQMPETGLASIIDSAKHYNTDYNQEIYQLQYNKQNLALQKALGVPDVTVGAEFDQAANYAPNYYGLAISLPIPILDRNRGNIKSAKWQVKAEETNMKLAEQKLQNDILGAYLKLQTAVNLNSSSNETFYQDYNQLYKNIVESYNSRQISMIEFLEYFNDYQDVRKNQLKQILDLRLAKESLNDIVGVDIAK